MNHSAAPSGDNQPSTAGTAPAADAARARAKSRLYLVDDQVLTRYGLGLLIAAEPDLEVCGESGTVTTALEQISRLKPDLVLLEVAMQGRSGLELMKSVRNSNPNIRMLVVSMYPEELYGLRAMRAGARGYVTKDQDVARIVPAIRRVLGGGLCVSASLSDRMLHGLIVPAAGSGGSLPELLSDRELEIATLIGHGHTTQEISIKLHLSVKTVETHRAHVKVKLDLKNATQLVQRCAQWVAESEPRAESA